MSYNRYSYSSPYGSHLHSSSNYSSPSGRYQSSSTYDYDSSRYGSGLAGGLGSGLGGSRSRLNQYSSAYDSGLSNYTPRSTYTPSYSSDYSRSSRYTSSSDYTPRSSDYTPRSSGYSRPTYDSDYSSKRTSKKTRVSPDYDPEPRKTKRTDREDKEVHFEKTERKSRRSKKTDEGGSPQPTRAADVTEITKKTENISVSSQNSAKPASHIAAPGSPRQQSARYQEQSGDYPEYHGYTNPSTQSSSFKQLQGAISSGQDPGSYFQKAPWQSQPVNQTSSEPRKYTPSATWHSVHGEHNQSSASQPRGPPAAQAPAAAAYRPPSANRPAHNQPPPQSNAPKPYGQPAAFLESNLPRAALGGNYSQQSTGSSWQAPAPAATPYRPPQHSPQNSWQPSTQSTNRFTGNQSAYTGHNYRSPPPAKPAGGVTQKIPHGEGDVATKGKASTQEGSADQTPICAHCNEEVRGPFVLALNKTWCPNHFTCAKCNSELVNMGFVELQGKIYCENDYETFFASKCAKCRQAIVGDTVNALEKTWHPKCFVCFECEAPISSGAFHVENGMPYCMKDWQRLFQTKCVSCGYPVEPGDKWIEALDANWHSECFTCAVCKSPLEGKPFYPKEGKPYCKDHAKA